MYAAQEERLKILDEQSQLAKELTRMKADVLKLDRELGEATYLLQNTRETMMHLKATQDLQAQQCLSLEDILYLRLPYAGYGIPCFKLRDTEVYLVVNKTLCSFTALEVRPLKTLGDDIFSWRRPSYFCRGTLYCSSNEGAARSYEIV
jgi:hypothetical protein